MIAKNLLVNGSSRFLGDMYGNLVGTINSHTVAKDVPSDAKFTDTTYSVVSAGTSTTAGGLMSQSDKTKLNGIATGAEVNQNAFSNIYIDAGNATLLPAGSKTDTFRLKTGGNIAFEVNTSQNQVTISAVDTIPSAYCNTASGTAAKVASCTGYVLRQHNYIQVIMVNANSYNGAITLNINGTGAKTIRINGSDSSSSNKTLPAGSYMVYYNGTQYCFNTSLSMPGYIDYAKYINMTSTTNKMFIGGTTSSSNSYKSLYFNPNVHIENYTLSINDNVILDGDTCDIQLISNSLSNTYSNLSPNHFYINTQSYSANYADTDILMNEILNSVEVNRVNISSMTASIYLNYTSPKIELNATDNPSITLEVRNTGVHGLYSSGYNNGSSFVSDPRWLIQRTAGYDNNLIEGNTYITGNLTTQTSTASIANYMRISHNGFGGTSIDMEVSASGIPGIYSARYWNGSSVVYNSGIWMIYRDTDGLVRTRSCSGTNSTPLVNTSTTDGKMLSGCHCNTSTQLALYGQWGTTGTTYAYRYVTVTTSDPRLKENIEPTKFNALELINKINLYSFDWKNDDTPHYDVGYIATELYELDHNLAIKPEDESEGYWGVNDYYMSGVQTKAIQELSAENNELRNKITSLEARIASLEALIK